MNQNQDAAHFIHKVSLVCMAVVALWAIIIACVGPVSAPRSWVIGSVAACVIIPISIVALWTHYASRDQESRHRTRANYVAINVLLLLAMLVSAIPAGLYAVIHQAWPLSLRMHLDSDFTRDGYRSMVGIDPPFSVSDIHYRVYGLFESAEQLRFTTSDPQLPAEIAQWKGWVKLDYKRPPLIKRDTDPGWWKLIRDADDLIVYSPKEDGSGCMWYEAVTGTVWLRRWDH